ncbi:MAG: hypothetical protein EA374_05740 [Acholeplasmatales bacterium]|nr:MAG: hypothetical protein EA374_05740 [Acholeplasmatales bacterium]
MGLLLFFLLYLGVVLFRMVFDYLNATVQTHPDDRRGYQAAQCQNLVNLTAVFAVFFAVPEALEGYRIIFIIGGWALASLWVMIGFDGHRARPLRRRLRTYLMTGLLKGMVPTVLVVGFTWLFFAGGPWLPYPLMGLILLGLIGTGYAVLFTVVVPRLFDKKPYVRPFAPTPAFNENPRVYVLKSRRLRLPINALYTGFFGRHSIWVSPALLGTLTHAQIDGILAHEIGHRRGGHLYVRLIFLVFGIAMVLLTAALAFTSPLVGNVGLPMTFPYQLAVFLVLYQIAETFVESLFYRLSHYQEFAADRYAAHLGRGAALAQALFVIAHHQVEPLLHPLSRRWQFSHPDHADRLKALRKAASLDADYGFVFECHLKRPRRSFQPAPPQEPLPAAHVETT